MKKVTVAILEHSSGEDLVRVFANPEAAHRWRIESAKQDWEIEVGGPMPADEDEMADTYWEHQNNCCREWFRSYNVEVES